MSAEVLTKANLNYVMKRSGGSRDINTSGTLSRSTSTSAMTSSNATPNTPEILEYQNITNDYNGIDTVDASPSYASSLFSRKRHMAPDDKLARCRERNRMHARKTRERKKNQMNALEQRIEDLHKESRELRLKIR